MASSSAALDASNRPRSRPALLRISEIYVAEQGEGLYAGTPSVFVRTTGCNLRCWFCDTPHTSWQAEGDTLSVDEVLERTLSFDAQHVVITGGEPLLQPAIVPLSRELQAAGRFLTVETAATVFRPVAADLMSISPKLENSLPEGFPWRQRHDQLRHNPSALEQFRKAYECQWKFVVDHLGDLPEVDAYVAELQLPPGEVWLMPQARTPEEVHDKTAWLNPEAERRGWRVSPRLHIERFGNVRGT